MQQKRHLLQAIKPLRVQKTLVKIFASKVILESKRLQVIRHRLRPMQDRDIRTGVGEKSPKNANCCAANVSCQSSSTHCFLLYLCLIRKRCLSIGQSTERNAHLQRQIGSTSFSGKSRATCRKKNRSCSTSSTSHEFGKEIENASIVRR